MSGRHRSSASVWRWLVATDVECVVDLTLPADARRCRTCLRTVRTPARLPRRHRLFCTECYLLETAW